jgi:hypothetical protein
LLFVERNAMSSPPRRQYVAFGAATVYDSAGNVALSEQRPLELYRVQVCVRDVAISASLVYSTRTHTQFSGYKGGVAGMLSDLLGGKLHRIAARVRWRVRSRAVM